MGIGSMITALIHPMTSSWVLFLAQDRDTLCCGFNRTTGPIKKDLYKILAGNSMSHTSQSVSELLESVSEGSADAKKKLFSILYNELRSLAHNAMMRENEGHMLQTTALVHETFISLVKNSESRWNNQEHFYKVAAKAMRYILVDEAKKRYAAKRGSGRAVIPLDRINMAATTQNHLPDLEELDKALEIMSKTYERQCSIVELRFFVGLTLKETAEVMGLSEATIKREWETARKWLKQRVNIHYD